jgi:hypothetical protein
MARAHMATPADPPASIIAGKDSGGEGAGSPEGSVGGSPDKDFFNTSYVAKYLLNVRSIHV